MEAENGSRLLSYRAILAMLLFLSMVGLFILKTSTLPAQEKCRLLQTKLSALEEEDKRLQDENQMLLEEFEALENDPFYIELYARDRFMMEGRREEIVFPLRRDQSSEKGKRAGTRKYSTQPSPLGSFSQEFFRE